MNFCVYFPIFCIVDSKNMGSFFVWTLNKRHDSLSKNPSSYKPPTLCNPSRPEERNWYGNLFVSPSPWGPGEVVLILSSYFYILASLFDYPFTRFTNHYFCVIHCIPYGHPPMWECKKKSRDDSYIILSSWTWFRIFFVLFPLVKCQIYQSSESHWRDESEIFLFFVLSCLPPVFSYNRRAPIPLGVGGLVTNLRQCMRNFLTYLVALLGYEIITRRVIGRDRKKILRNLRK